MANNEINNLVNGSIITGLLPANSGSIIPKVTTEDLLKSLVPTSTKDATSLLQGMIDKYKNNIYTPEGKLNTVDYREYLQIGNPKIKELVSTIIKPGDSNDVKAQKILDWVQKNITYVPDAKQYRKGEYWAKPTETLKSKQGDCEDGSFLIHSMMLAAGIPASKVRTYGGLVEAGTNAPLGGHAWTIYKRDSDNKWVDLDWCYYPEKTGTPMEKRETFKSQDEYVDAFWWMNAFGTYDEYGKWGISIYA